MSAKTKQGRTHTLANNAKPTFLFMLEEKKILQKKDQIYDLYQFYFEIKFLTKCRCILPRGEAIEWWITTVPNTAPDSPSDKSGVVPVEIKGTLVLVEGRSDTATTSTVI